MKVLWLAPIAITKNRKVTMPPWIGTLANALVEKGDIQLTILNYHARLDQDSITVRDGAIEWIFLKTPVPKLDFIQLYSQRIKIINNYIKKREKDFDLIHIHGTEHQYESSLTGVKLPVILSMQGVMEACVKALPGKLSYTYLSWKMAAAFERFNMARVHNFMCRTHFDNTFVKKRNPRANRFEVWEMIRPAFFEVRDISNQPNALLFAGGTHPIKGLDLVLGALNDLHRRGKVMINLKIVGNAEAHVVKKMIDKNNLEYINPTQVELLGFVDAVEMAKIYQTVFALIHPSRIDNSPNTVCEAQVAGLPVIASDVGGLTSLINHYETGILTSLHPENIANEILKLKSDPVLWQKISISASKTARARHNCDDIRSKTINIYKNLITHQKHEPALSAI